MNSVEQIIKKLKIKARPDQLEEMARFGLVKKRRLGVSIPELRQMAQEIGKKHKLSLKLWKTGFQEARILASMIDNPEDVTEQQMESWVKDIESWDVCDQVCMNLLKKVPFINKKIIKWSCREEEFIKRSAYTLIACLAVYKKQAPDEEFIKFFPIIKKGAKDDRHLVKKSVSWALRNIGKRNQKLNISAIKVAKDIRKIESKAACWIATDVIKELESEAVQIRLKR